MPIRIKEISVKNCGPIGSFTEELDDLNLFYSENEKGKSYLVEFIIHSLFKNKSYWQDLRQPGQGKILISGIDDKVVVFSPSSKRKLEDYIEGQKKGLPPSLSNLLVVKEGQTEIVKNAYGVDKNTFKEILSPRKVLDEIVQKISATTRGSKIEDGEISIKRQGEGKDYFDLREKIKKIEELIKSIINEYEQGEIKDLQLRREKLLEEKQLLLKAKKHMAYLLSKELESLQEKEKQVSETTLEKLKNHLDRYKKLKEKLEELDREINQLRSQTEKLRELEERLDLLVKAKRYEAYRIFQEIKRIEEKLKKFSEEELSHLQNSINQYFDKFSEKTEKIRILNQLKEKSKNYNWLKSARENYNKFLVSNLKINKKVLLIPYFALLILICGILLIILEKKIPGIILIIISAIGSLYYTTKMKNSFVNFKEDQELKSLKEEFLKRFSIELENLATLEEKLYEEEKSYYTLETYEKEIDRLNIEINSLRQKIEETFHRLQINATEEAEWQKKLSEIREERKFLLSRYEKLMAILDTFDVDEANFEYNDPGIKFNQEEMEETKNKIAKLKSIKEQEIEKEREKKDIDKELAQTKEEINEIFKGILGTKIEEYQWIEKSEELERQKKELENEIKKIEGMLQGLGVAESEYEKQDPQKQFSPQEFERVERELEILNERINEKNQENTKLKERIIQLTGIDLSANWNEMIERVYSYRRELSDALEEVEAKIVAGILVYETINELQKEDDEILLEKINSPEIVSLVKKITGRYKTFDFSISSFDSSPFDKNDIIITDDYSSFRLRDLSTGAKEQVMIALRIGLAKSLLKGQPAFLILDDAFQHSDYKKRLVLINTMFELAQEGWQIIYLTMDDHIRDLFKEKSINKPVKFKEFSF